MKPDKFKIFFVVIGLLLTGLTTSMTFSLHRLVKELDLNTRARQENVVIDAQQSEKIKSNVKKIDSIECEVKDIDKRVVRLESKP